MGIAIVTGYVWGALTIAAGLELSQFQAVEWETHHEARVGLSIDYPYQWSRRNGVLRDESFYASDETSLPSVSIAVHPHDEGAELASLDAKAAAQFGPTAHIDQVEIRDIAGVPARVIDVRWGLPLGSGLALRSRVISLLRGPHWVLVRASDGIPVDGTLLDTLQRSLDSIRVDANWSATQ